MASHYEFLNFLVYIITKCNLKIQYEFLFSDKLIRSWDNSFIPALNQNQTMIQFDKNSPI